METIECLIKIRHKKNVELVNFINSLKENDNGPIIFILTDRSALGLKNVWKEVSGVSADYIQIRSRIRRGKRRGIEEKIKSQIGGKVEIFISSFLKPHRNVLYPLVLFIKQKGIRSDEVLIVDDNQDFLRVARTFFRFKVFPSPDELFINKKEREGPELFQYLFSRVFNRA